MATVTAVRSIFRSTFSRSAMVKFGSSIKADRSRFRMPIANTLSPRFLWCTVELSACVETMQPFHTVTASALMASMLTISRCSPSLAAAMGAF